MEDNRPPDQVSAGEIAKFLVSTRRGRVLAFVYLAAAAFLGLLLGCSVPPTPCRQLRS
jgi:hypothetical protein